MPRYLSRREMLSLPLPGFTARRDRLALRTMALAMCGRIELHASHRLESTPAPLIVAINHLNNVEAVALPALLMLLRGGHVRFFADWTARLYPGMSWCLTRSKAILVWRKRARWRPIDHLLRQPDSRGAIERACEILSDDNVLGVYPEGTRNHDPDYLLPARSGLARLALMTGVSVLPIGVDYHGRANGQRAEGWLRLIVRVGTPLQFPRSAQPSPAAVGNASDDVMRALARLSGKQMRPVQRALEPAIERLEPASRGPVHV